MSYSRQGLDDSRVRKTEHRSNAIPAVAFQTKADDEKGESQMGIAWQRGERVALVTGGAGGIGHVSARAFAQKGYRVVVADMAFDKAQVVANDICQDGGDAIALPVDIANRESVEALMTQIEAHYGRLDVAFNNAGVGNPKAPIADCDDEVWLRSINVNLTGTWYCLKAEIRWMERLGGGCIINNGSVYALRAGPNAPYTAAKHGIAGLTKSAAMTYASKNIRINAVCPGLIDAGMGAPLVNYACNRGGAEILIDRAPLGRAGTAEDVANAVLWLCSDEASFVHGHMLAIDGGFSA